MINSRMIKRTIGLNSNQYDRSRLYPLKNDGYKIKFYDIGHDVYIFELLKNIQNCAEFDDYSVSYEISENIQTRDLTLVFDRKTAIAYGLKELAPDFEQHISDAAYYLAEKRGFVVGFELEDWLRAKQQVFLSYGD